MPAFLTHQIAAQNIEKELPPDIQRLIEDHPDAYFSGAQGGDYFQSFKYYSMWAGYRLKMFGWALHRARVRRFFLDGADWIKEHPSGVAEAYFLGYITHYALDMHVHPLVIKISGRNMKIHNRVESALDCMFALQNGIDPWHYDRARQIRDTYVESGEIDEFLLAMSRSLYGSIFSEHFLLPPEPYHTAYAYFEDFHRMLQQNDRRSRFLKSMHDLITIMKTRSLDYLPYDVIRKRYDYADFFRRLEAAESHAARMIEAVFRFWKGNPDRTAMESVFYGINMSGVPIVPIEERDVFKRLYKEAPTVK